MNQIVYKKYYYYKLMPIYKKHNSKGNYFQWGDSGKKYYYIKNDVVSTNSAYMSAVRQAKAAHSRGYKK